MVEAAFIVAGCTILFVSIVGVVIIFLLVPSNGQSRRLAIGITTIIGIASLCLVTLGLVQQSFDDDVIVANTSPIPVVVVTSFVPDVLGSVDFSLTIT